MIIIQVSGGLGNQLQQYALYEKFISMGKQAKLDVSEYQRTNRKGTYRTLELDKFPNVSYIKASEYDIEMLLKNKSIIHRIGRRLGLLDNSKYIEKSMYDPKVFCLNNAYIEGYFSCEKYFNDIIQCLSDKLQFPKQLDSKNHETALCMNSEESVSIHIRRSDYLNPENIDIFSNICTAEYYQSAIKYIEQICNSPHFYIFSDDIEYARKCYRDDKYTIVDWNTGNNSHYDMFLMSQCKYNICANSTFSFWGARLNQHQNKVMIRPLKQRNNATYDPETIHKLWISWILIDEFGNIV